jgi:hypothetical protein
MSRIIAVIGTAGRDKTRPMTDKHWDFMCETIAAEVKPEDTLVSGGAAWADHVAIWAYGTGLVKSLILHLPAPFVNGKFEGPSMSAGQTCNYYHGLFSEVMGFKSLDHIKQAFMYRSSVAITEEPASSGYGAFAARNRKVGNTCTHMVAFTFAEGDVPADGGTKMTWDMAADKLRIHVPLGAV